MVIGAVVAVAAIIAFNAVPRGGKTTGGKTVPDTIEAIKTHEITDTVPFMCADYTEGWWMGTVNDNNEPAGKGVFYYRDDDKDGRSEYRGCIYGGVRQDAGKATLTYKMVTAMRVPSWAICFQMAHSGCPMMAWSMWESFIIQTTSIKEPSTV